MAAKLIQEKDLRRILNSAELASRMSWHDDENIYHDANVLLRSPEQLYALGVQDIHDARLYAMAITADVASLKRDTRVEIDETVYRVLATPKNQFGVTRVLLGTDSQNVQGDYYGWEQL